MTIQNESCPHPPPYRLTADLAAFPLRGDAAALAHWLGGEPAALLGSALVWLLCARYHAASSGPERTPVRFDGGPDLYREVALAAVTGWLPARRLQFPRLWVDSPDPLPLTLGAAYGFPKVPATVRWEQPGGGLQVGVDAGGVAVLEIQATAAAGLPVAPLAALMAVTIDLPARAQRAPLRLVGARRAALLRVRRWSAPRHDRWGISGGPWFGLWLEEAELVLGAPRAADPSP